MAFHPGDRVSVKAVDRGARVIGNGGASGFRRATRAGASPCPITD